MEEVGAMVDVVFEEMKRDPVAVGRFRELRAVVVPELVRGVELRAIAQEALEALPRSAVFALDLRFRAGSLVDVGCSVAVSDFVAKPTVTGARDVQQNAAKVP